MKEKNTVKILIPQATYLINAIVLNLLGGKLDLFFLKYIYFFVGLSISFSFEQTLGYFCLGRGRGCQKGGISRNGRQQCQSEHFTLILIMVSLQWGKNF